MYNISLCLSIAIHKYIVQICIAGIGLRMPGLEQVFVTCVHQCYLNPPHTNNFVKT